MLVQCSALPSLNHSQQRKIKTDSRNFLFLTALLLKIQVFRKMTATFRSMQLSQTWTLALRRHCGLTVQGVTAFHNCHLSLPADKGADSK